MTETEPIRVLVVDDQDLVRSGFKMILNTYDGIEIVGEAKTGAQAVEEAQRLKADVVLMDIQMPVMDGHQATKAIRALEDRKLARVPIIALSANAFAEDYKRSLEAGMDAHISKPIRIEELQETIRNVLERLYRE